MEKEKDQKKRCDDSQRANLKENYASLAKTENNLSLIKSRCPTFFMII